MNPQITIVIPVYNRADIVGRTLASVAAQTWRPLRVILVDNNSTDNTLQVLNGWKDAVEADGIEVEVMSETRPGASAARNAGLARVTTPWTMFFDSDDEMLPLHVEQAMRAVEGNPEAGVVGWSRRICSLDGTEVVRRFAVRDAVFNNIMHSTFATQNYMARTELLRRAGGWDESLSMGDDVQLGHRLLMLNPVLCQVEGDTTVVVHESAVSITNDGRRMATIMKAYDAIRDTLPARQRRWVDFRSLILAVSWGRNDPAMPEFVENVLRRAPWPRRQLWRALTRYTAAGHRGAARIYSLLRFL